MGERRAFRPGGGAAGTGARGTDGTNGVDGLGDAEDEEYYGQLLRRPDDRPPYRERLRQPDGPHMQQPGHFAPPDGQPGSGYRPNGDPASGYSGRGNQAGRYPQNGEPVGGGYPGHGDYSGSGDPGSGYLRTGYLPNGDLAGGYPGSANPVGGYPQNGEPVGGGYPGHGDYSGSGYPPDGGPAGRRQYRLPNGRRVPPDADRPYRPGAPGSAGGTRPGAGQDPLGGAWSRQARPARPAPAAGGAPGPGGAYGRVRADGGGGWEHLRVPPAGRGVPVPSEPPVPAGPAGPGGPAGPAGPVIRQRESALPGERPTGAAQPVASIAPDGLESFARDLRALRGKAGLDYPEMAEVSHYTMKTLASAAAGLRLPTLPVAVAYVRACGGNVAEWEDRWQKLAAKITADAKKRRADGDDHQAPPEPADPPAVPEPPALPAAREPDPAPGEVYVITSAKPRPQDW